MISKNKAILLTILLLLAGFLLLACHNNNINEDTDETIPSVPTESLTKFIYESDGSCITIIGYSGIESTISIPAEIDGLPVTAIAENAFREVTALTKIYLPDSIETIDYAFVSCPDLIYVRLGKKITSMNGAFRGCTKLSTVEGNPAAEQLDEAFLGCAALTTGHIPATAKSAMATYADCTALTDVIVEEGITTLTNTFENCTALKTIALPASLTELSYAFSGCTSLRDVTGGEGLITLNAAFHNCVSLTAFTFSQPITTMTGAFVGCSSLSTLTGMPESLAVYTASFTGCRSLTALRIPAIEDEASLASYNPAVDLAGCEKLETVTILANYPVREEFCKIFVGCPSLESVTLPDDIAVAMLRLSYTYTDAVFEGTNKTLAAAVKKWKKATAVRVTDHYGIIDSVPYTHIYGGDVDVWDIESVIAETNLLTFEPFEKATYWCGYPENGNRKEDTVGIQRTYSFTLRTTGKNDGTLPETLILNGLFCAVGE